VPPELPEQIAARLREDAIAEKLAARVLHWLPAAGYAQLGLFERATFRVAHMRQLSRRSRLLAKTLLLPYRRRLARQRQGSETGFSMPSAATSGCLPVASV